MRILTPEKTTSSRGGLTVEESAVRWRSTADEKRHQNLADLIVEETLITKRLATLYVWVNWLCNSVVIFAAEQDAEEKSSVRLRLMRTIIALV